MRVSRIRSLGIVSLLALAVACGGADETQIPEGQSVDDWIAGVEGALLPALLVEDVELTGYTLAERMENYHVPAVSAAVIENGQIVWAKAWGEADLEAGSPATTETLFQAASISKPVAALVALSLVEDGRLELDGPVNHYLTSWTIPDNEFTADSAVTLRGILTHSAGLSVWGFPGYRKDEPFNDEQALATNPQVLEGEGNTDPVRVYKVPGTSWQYSGGGYTVMEQMLEDVTGGPFHTIATSRVLTPAGMTRSTYEQPLSEERWAEASRGHRGDGAEVEGEWHTYPEQAAAGLWTTPTELATLSVHLLRILDGTVTDGVITRDMLSRMLTPNRDGDEDFNDWGLGFGISEIDGQRAFGHGGSNEGFRASWQMFPDLGVGYAIMTNGDAGGALAAEMARAIAAVRGWPVHRVETRVRMRPEAAEIAALAGNYDVEGADDFVVEVRPGDDATLEFIVPGQGAFTWYATSPDEWFDPSDGQELTVERDEDGNVTGVLLDGETRLVRRTDG